MNGFEKARTPASLSFAFTLTPVVALLQYFLVSAPTSQTPALANQVLSPRLARACQGCFVSVFRPASVSPGSRFLASRIMAADPSLNKLPRTIRLQGGFYQRQYTSIRGTGKVQQQTIAIAAASAEAVFRGALPEEGGDSWSERDENVVQSKTRAVDKLRCLLRQVGSQAK